MPIAGVFITKQGDIVLPCDAATGGKGGTAIHIGKDGGKAWTDPGAGTPKPDSQHDPAGGTIAGIHAGVAGHCAGGGP